MSTAVLRNSIHAEGKWRRPKIRDEVGQDHFKLGYGRRRGRRCRAGVALRANRGGGRCRRRWHCGGEGRQRSAGKAQTEAKTAARTRTKSAAKKASAKRRVGQEEVRQAEAITSAPRSCRLAPAVAIIDAFPPTSGCAATARAHAQVSAASRAPSSDDVTIATLMRLD